MINVEAFEQELDSTAAILQWDETDLNQRWQRKVSAKNDFLLCVSPSSQTSGSGSGKTTLATTLAQKTDRSDGGFDAETKATLDAGDLAYEILPNIEEGSAVIFDEAQGAPGTSSVNARRGMTAEAIDAINGILANRDKNLTLIVVVQQLAMLDKMLYPMIDAWLLITRDPSHPNGPRAVHHTFMTDDYDLQDPQIKTPAHEWLTWSDLPADDDDYAEMERKKQEAKRQRGESENETTEDNLTPRARNRLIAERADEGVKQKHLAETFNISRQRVSQIISEYEG
jgi:hypothetical protein